VTNGLNPKATLFFLSLFTVVINPHTPLMVQAGYGIYLAAATATWFCLVAMLFSQQRVRAGFARMGHWFDRTMGGTDCNRCEARVYRDALILRGAEFAQLVQGVQVLPGIFSQQTTEHRAERRALP
jgi:hypothetical protein